MGGANLPSSVGAVYLVVDLNEALVTIVIQGDEFHICHRETKHEIAKKIVAICKNRRLADKIHKLIEREGFDVRTT